MIFVPTFRPFLTTTKSTPSPGITYYTTNTDLIAAMNSGYYLETFNAYAVGFYGSPQDFSGGTPTLTYSIADYGFDLGFGLFVPSPNEMSTNSASDNLSITTTSNNINAIGCNIFLEDIGGNRITDGSTLTVTINGTFTKVLTPTVENPTPFVGFKLTGETISTVTFVQAYIDTINYVTMTNLYSGIAL